MSSGFRLSVSVSAEMAQVLYRQLEAKSIEASRNLEFRVAKLPENLSLNRWHNVLPYDVTRVKLSPPFPRNEASSNQMSSSNRMLTNRMSPNDLSSSSDMSSSNQMSVSSNEMSSNKMSSTEMSSNQTSSTDYINASYVDVAEAERCYILTQGPLQETVWHFWAMVHQVRIYI